MIKHLPGPFSTRSRAVIHEGRVHAVSFVTDKKPDMYLQTKSALAHIDATLREAGTDKSRILTAIVYIADMKRKPEMNRSKAKPWWRSLSTPSCRACTHDRVRSWGQSRRGAEMTGCRLMNPMYSPRGDELSTSNPVSSLTKACCNQVRSGVVPTLGRQ